MSFFKGKRITKNEMEILKLKNTTFENLKIHWMGLTKKKKRRWQEKESVNLKTDQ